MNNELTTFIIKELRKHRSRKDVIRKICERGSLNWKDAERLFILVQAQHRQATIPRQAPMLLFLSIAILILGVGLLGFNLQIVLAFFQKDLVQQIFSLQGTAYRAIGFMIGFAMSIGGLVGLWKAFGTIFPE